MESLALAVGLILLVLLLLSTTSVVLCILRRFGRVSKLVAYIAFGLQALLTLFSFQLTVQLGTASLVVLGACAALIWLPKSKKSTKE